MDRKLEDYGPLTRMGPRLIMNLCPIFHGLVFSRCKRPDDRFSAQDQPGAISHNIMDVT